MSLWTIEGFSKSTASMIPHFGTLFQGEGFVREIPEEAYITQFEATIARDFGKIEECLKDRFKEDSVLTCDDPPFFQQNRLIAFKKKGKFLAECSAEENIADFVNEHHEETHIMFFLKARYTESEDWSYQAMMFAVRFHKS